MASNNLLFLFPGQGSQHPYMAHGLYESDPAFTTAFDRVIDAYGPEGRAARSDWLSTNPTLPLDEPLRSQLLLFAVDYALGTAMLQRGHEPVGMLGHSIGEVAAACLAGVVALEDIAPFLVYRMRQLQDYPPGGMIAVAASPADVEPATNDEVVIGAFNAPRQVVLAGPDTALPSAQRTLDQLGYVYQQVPSSSGFHSPMLASHATESLGRVRDMPLQPPRLAIYSCYQEGSLDAYATDPAYWASHPSAPVQFWRALDHALRSHTEPVTLVELGPSRNLTTFARRHPLVRSGHHSVISALPAPPTDAESDRASWEAVQTVFEETAP